MSRVAVSSDIAERCLGPIMPGVRGIYDRCEFRDEKAKAYQALARMLTFVEPVGRVRISHSRALTDSSQSDVRRD